MKIILLKIKNILNRFFKFLKKAIIKFLKLKSQTKIIISSVALVLVVGIVLGIIFGSRAIGLRSAFKYNKSAYSHAQISVEKTITVFNLGFDETDSSTEGDTEYKETRNIKIYKDSYSETTDDTEICLYKENEKNYVSAYESTYGEKTDKSAWTVSEISEPEDYKYFSFSSLKDINIKNLNCKNGVYTPEFEYLDKYFYKLHNVSSLSESLYIVESVSIKIKNNKIKQIEFKYIYNSEQSVTEILTFKYKKQKVNLPNFSENI